MSRCALPHSPVALLHRGCTVTLLAVPVWQCPTRHAALKPISYAGVFVLARTSSVVVTVLWILGSRSRCIVILPLTRRLGGVLLLVLLPPAANESDQPPAR